MKSKDRSFCCDLISNGINEGGRIVGIGNGITNVSVIVPPLPSLAITSMETAPTKVLVGMPLKVRVAESKLNHAGNAPPPASCAL